jgi:ABC-type uncharacterized transport system auxiliary subunit
MKTKAIIVAGLVTLALLAGCGKEKESTTTISKSVTTPASPEQPIQSQESTSTTTTVIKSK